MPTNAIGPQKAVILPARRQVHDMIRNLTALMFKPIVMAYRSPSSKAFRGFIRRKLKVNEKRVTGTKACSWFQPTLPRLPKVQNKYPCICSGLLKNCRILTIAPVRLANINPMMRRLILSLTLAAMIKTRIITTEEPKPAATI